jgi:hypothetical protein
MPVAIQYGFFGSAHDSDHRGFIHRRGTANRLGNPEELHSLHAGFHHAIFAGSVLNQLFYPLFAHLTKVALHNAVLNASIQLGNY